VAIRSVALALVLQAARVAAAQEAPAPAIDLKLSGSLYNDVRYVVAEKNLDGGALAVPTGFDRNDTRLRWKAVARAGEHAKGVADVELVWTGFSRVPYVGQLPPRPDATLDDLSNRLVIDPLYVNAYAAYVDLYKVAPGLDLRLGRQVTTWGTADKFNPTNNLNPLDFEDPLRFGEGISNDMVRADWNPRGDFIVTMVWVPLFRPARLPRTAPLGLESLARLPFQDDDFRHLVSSLVPPGILVRAHPLLPPTDLQDSQVAVKVAGRIGTYDLSLSYYNGRHDLPTPVHALASIEAGQLVADVTLGYPRMQVIGFDSAGSLPWLYDLGYWIEGALVFPQEIRLGVDVAIPGQPSRLLDASGQNPLTVASTPYLKATVGADYTVGPHSYVNAQYVHGFIDEFGGGRTIWRASFDPGREVTAPREGDYAVAGTDLKLLRDRLLLRLFVVYDLNDGSAVVFPQSILTGSGATELTVGAFLFVGSPVTKFGDPAAGGSQVFARAKISW